MRAGGQAFILSPSSCFNPLWVIFEEDKEKLSMEKLPTQFRYMRANQKDRQNSLGVSLELCDDQILLWQALAFPWQLTGQPNAGFQR